MCVGLIPQCETQRRNSSKCLNSLVKLLFPGCYGVHTLFVTPADETSFEAGIKVQIHSQDEPSFIDQLGFGVAPGFQTFVSCQEQRVKTFACGNSWRIIRISYNLGLIFVPLSINFIYWIQQNLTVEQKHAATRPATIIFIIHQSSITLSFDLRCVVVAADISSPTLGRL